MEILWKLAAKALSQPWIANRLIARAKQTPYSDILSPDGSGVYMGRWWLFNPYDNETRETKHGWCPISVRIHHILQPDGDRDLHDHPWNARTIILKGGYLEEREDSVRLRVAGDTSRLRFGEYHRISSVLSGGAVTLFITGKYRGTWGFRVNGKKIPWRKYLGIS